MSIIISVADPDRDPNPQDPYVFGLLDPNPQDPYVFGLLDPDSDLLVRGTDSEPYPFIIKQKK